MDSSLQPFLATVGLLLCTFLSAFAQERKVDRSALPTRVQKAIAVETQGSTVLGFAEETEDGKKFYEAEATINGHSKDILFDENGSVMEIEEEVRVASLPPKVRKALVNKAAGAKIIKVESLTKRGRVVAYEAQIRGKGKNSEIQVGPQGEALAIQQ